MQFDSKEEIYFYWWLLELEKEGYIKDIRKASTVLLETSVIKCGHEILPEISYTADFVFTVEKQSEYLQDINDIRISPKARKNKALIYQVDKTNGKKMCLVETKANFDNRDKTREVNIKRKWVYSKFDIFIELVKVPKIFEQTFVPRRYLRTDMDTANRKINFKYKLLLDGE